MRRLLHPGCWVDYVRRFASDVALADDPITLYKLRRPTSGRHTLRVRFRGHRMSIQVRGGTMDVELARLILCEDSEYRVPAPITPRVIFDIGANIGMTALYLACVYPDAHIYCFEPLPDNLELLRTNVANFAGRITVVPKGLGEAEAVLPYFPSNDPRNFGGGGFRDAGCDTDHAIDLPVTTVAEVCNELGIDRVDLFKIDTEGAELGVLLGTPPRLIAQASALIGELHGVGDLQFLQRLAPTHDLGVTKAHDRRCYPFVAIARRHTAAGALCASAAA